MSSYNWILDAGHGGLVKGKYTTAPGKMFTFPDGLVFQEGVNNRTICRYLQAGLTAAAIDHALVHDEGVDTPLKTRVKRANDLHAKAPGRCVYLSIHSDCMPEGAHGKAGGFSIWTSIGQTKSDKLANIFLQVYEKEFSQDFRILKDVSDGDKDKEENFFVLKQTNCPAVLFENLFYDNRREADFLLSTAGQQRIAATILEGIKLVEQLRPI